MISVAFDAARSVKLASSAAFVFGALVAPVLGREVCSSEFFRPDTEGADEASFLDWSFGRGFLASSMLKPGGGPLSPPWVDVSVA